MSLLGTKQDHIQKECPKKSPGGVLHSVLSLYCHYAWCYNSYMLMPEFKVKDTLRQVVCMYICNFDVSWVMTHDTLSHVYRLYDTVLTLHQKTFQIWLPQFSPNKTMPEFLAQGWRLDTYLEIFLANNAPPLLFYQVVDAAMELPIIHDAASAASALVIFPLRAITF